MNYYTLKQLKEINKCYWTQQAISNSSMLGGYDSINNVDIKQSEIFLLKNVKNFQSVIELGSGVGRISQQLLSKYFKELYLVERESKFLEESKIRLKNFNCTFYETSVEELKMERNYDLAWIQWISMYLTDDEFCKMLLKLKHTPIILKENVCQKDYQFDESDGSITRSNKVYKNLIQQCGLKIVDEEFQQDLPDDIYKINMFYLNNNA